MRIDRREQLMVVYPYSNRKQETAMLPYKMQQEIYPDEYPSRRSTRMQDHNDRKEADSSSSFDDLARKVDWLYEEVRYIKQTLDTYRRTSVGNYEPSAPYRTYNHPPRVHERSSGRHEILRSNPIPTPTERIRYYDQQQPRSGSREPPVGYLPTTTAPTSSANTSSRHYTRSDSSYGECTPPQPITTRSFTPREVPPPTRSDRDSVTYSSSSPTLSNAKSDIHGAELLHNIPEDITIAEIVFLWERGMNDVPAVLEWEVQDKLKNRDKLELFFKVYHIYRTVCNADLSIFVSQFTDAFGRMRSPSYVASQCPDVAESFDGFLQASKTQSTPYDLSTDKLYTLPRKINGRKVSAKDVIQLWEYGMGDVPPIKTWTKAQKFKQQSKISRWKKIVDIFKYQCNSDMRKFEEIYTDSHGCLLPVAAITNKFETLYGDELNITSKLMTVTTSEQQKQSEENSRKRKNTEGSLSDGESNHGYGHYNIEEQDSSGNLTASLPPLLVPANSVMSPHKLVKREDDDEQQKYGYQHSNNNVENSSKQNNDDSLGNQSTGDKKESSSLTYEDQSSPSSISSNANDENNDLFKRSASIIYIIPDVFTIKDAISYWETGSQDFPPVRTWTHVQNSIQQDLIVKIEKLYDIYSEQFHQDIDALLSSAVDESGDELSIDQFLTKYAHHHQETRKLPNANSMTFDFSHHKTISQSTDALYLLPRKINGRKVSAKDVLQLWYHGLNKIPPVKQWSPQQKAVQQSKISRWKKIVELFEQDFGADWEKFKKHYSNSLGQLLPITAIISKHEEESRTMTEGAYHPNL